MKKRFVCGGLTCVHTHTHTEACSLCLSLCVLDGHTSPSLLLSSFFSSGRQTPLLVVQLCAVLFCPLALPRPVRDP